MARRRRKAGLWFLWALPALLGCDPPASQAPEEPPSKKQKGLTKAPRKASGHGCVAPKEGKLARCQIRKAEARGAVCNDGSPGMFYLRPGSGGGRNKWVIHHEGGGLAGSLPELAVRWLTQNHLMTSKSYPDHMSSAGIFAKSPKNPFGNWNHVLIKYCSSDLHIGASERASQLPAGKTKGVDNPQKWRFAGKAIAMAVLDDLSASGDGHAALGDATDVLLSGGSAGSGGLRQNIDAMAHKVRAFRGGKPVKIRGVADSAFWPDTSGASKEMATLLARRKKVWLNGKIAALQATLAKAGFGELVSQFKKKQTQCPSEAEIKGCEGKQGWCPMCAALFQNRRYDESCVKAQGDNRLACRDSLEVLEHIETPLFLSMDLADPKLLERYGIGKSRPTEDDEKIIAFIANTLRDQFKAHQKKHAEDGAFVSMEGYHTALRNTCRAAKLSVEQDGKPYVLGKVLWRWYTGDENNKSKGKKAKKREKVPTWVIDGREVASLWAKGDAGFRRSCGK